MSTKSKLNSDSFKTQPESSRGKKAVLRHLWVVALIIAVSTLHYLTPVAFHHFHAIYQRLYYLPILLACYHFGLKTGLAYALFCGLFYLPHIFIQWSDAPHESFVQYLEILLFLVVAGLAGWLFDLRRRRQAEILIQQESLQRAERLSLLGKLAAGLAHEIRNPLNSLIGAADIVKNALGPNHPEAEFGIILETELKRVNRILNRFLDFARPREIEYLPHDLNQVIAATLALATKTLQTATITVETRLNSEIPAIPMDAEMIKQALLNLILNAQEAMPKGGTILVETEWSNGEALLRVSDEGDGIPPGNREAIFDPFYTTKESGTGLGLAVSRQIAERHQGKLRVIDSPKGACFELRLPGGVGHE